ncbi:hypothetical protein MRB53_037249 [Persea americana]|nr:hypothetical protein MRB53_037249 [Persea americana]
MAPRCEAQQLYWRRRFAMLPDRDGLCLLMQGRFFCAGAWLTLSHIMIDKDCVHRQLETSSIAGLNAIKMVGNSALKINASSRHDGKLERPAMTRAK